MILFRNVSLSRGKSTTRFWEVSVFPKKSDNFIGRETKHTFYLRKSADLTIILSEYCNHSTTTTTLFRRPATVSWWRGLVPVTFAPDGEARSWPGVTVAGGATVQSDMTVIITSVWSGAQEPKSGLPDGGVRAGRGGRRCGRS